MAEKGLVWLLIQGGLFTGLGIGIALENPGAGLLTGRGLGFIATTVLLLSAKPGE